MARDNNQVEARGQLRPAEPERLAEESLPAVARDGVADLARDGQPEPAVRQTVLAADDYKPALVDGAAPAVRPLEVGVAADAVLA